MYILFHLQVNYSHSLLNVEYFSPCTFCSRDLPTDQMYTYCQHGAKLHPRLIHPFQKVMVFFILEYSIQHF